jgi:ABC-type branched-subunit amino acid transport system substrate-binding protein
MHAAVATEVLLDAIARSDGTRASVLDELRGIEIKRGIIGSFHFDRFGDMTPAKLTILRVRLGAKARDRLPGHSRAVLDRVLTVPTGSDAGAGALPAGGE